LFILAKATIVPFCIALKVLVFIRLLFVGKLTKWERNITSRGVGVIFTVLLRPIGKLPAS
jgi:hypothetical protein